MIPKKGAYWRTTCTIILNIYIEKSFSNFRPNGNFTHRDRDFDRIVQPTPAQILSAQKSLARTHFAALVAEHAPSRDKVFYRDRPPQQTTMRCRMSSAALSRP